MILGCLLSVTLREHTKCLGICMWPPLHPPNHPDDRGQTFCNSPGGDTEAKGMGRTEERLDLGGHVEACKHESLRGMRSCIRSVTHMAPQPRDQCNLEGIPAVEDGGGGLIDRGNPGLTPPPPQGSMALDEVVVQGRVQPRAAACLSNPRADHGGARCAVFLSTTPGREYFHICRAFPSGGIGTYGGQDIVSGLEV